jgi:hypothetical protein
MDYAFAPGTSPYEGYLRSMLQHRISTTLISNAGLTSIADFLGQLVTQTVTGAGDLVPGSHASDEGNLFLALDSTTTTLPVNYEILDAVKTSGTINIPAAVRGATTSLHFKGCRIGSDDALPFLQLLKEALDNPQSVTAPKYFHGLYNFSGVGVFEHMDYSYMVMNITPYPDTASLVAAFVAGGFTQGLDGTAVPDANFKTWVKPTLNLKPANQDKVKFNFPVAITPKAGGIGSIPQLKAQCRSRAEKFTYTVSGLSSIPTSDADRLALIKSGMDSDPMMQDTHPYPLYQRLHFPDFDSLWTGLDWKTSVNGTDLIAVGTHYVYTLVIPILKPGSTTNELVYNFYPATGTPVMNFLEDNATYNMFGVV